MKKTLTVIMLCLVIAASLQLCVCAEEAAVIEETGGDIVWDGGNTEGSSGVIVIEEDPYGYILGETPQTDYINEFPDGYYTGFGDGAGDSGPEPDISAYSGVTAVEDTGSGDGGYAPPENPGTSDSGLTQWVFAGITCAAAACLLIIPGRH